MNRKEISFSQLYEDIRLEKVNKEFAQALGIYEERKKEREKTAEQLGFKGKKENLHKNLTKLKGVLNINGVLLFPIQYVAKITGNTTRKIRNLIRASWLPEPTFVYKGKYYFTRRQLYLIYRVFSLLREKKISLWKASDLIYKNWDEHTYVKNKIREAIKHEGEGKSSQSYDHKRAELQAIRDQIFE